MTQYKSGDWVLIDNIGSGLAMTRVRLSSPFNDNGITSGYHYNPLFGLDNAEYGMIDINDIVRKMTSIEVESLPSPLK